MKRKLLSFLVVCLLLSLTACAQPSAEIEDDYPTLPSISENQTPLEQLQSAVSGTYNAGSCTVRYGTIRKTDEDSHEDSFSQTLSDAQSLDWDALYDAVPLFPNHPDFLEGFCSRPIRVIPSNTGTLRYQLSDLSWDEMASLIYSQPSEENFSQAVCAVAMDIDAHGRLSHMALTIETEEQTLTVFLTVSFTESP